MKRFLVPAAVWLLLALGTAGPAAAAPEEGTNLRILHVNDLHGWLLPRSTGEKGSPTGGLAALAAAVERHGGEGSLFLAAGDLMAGTNISNLFRGEPVVAALNVMGLAATAVGNHEFDFGVDVLAARAAEADFPFLAANITGAGAGIFEDVHVVDYGSLKIALFGLTTTETRTSTHPRNVAGLLFGAPVAAARRIIAGPAATADVVICLSHLGLSGDLRLAREVPGIDVIVGGHTHTPIETPLTEGDTVIVQAFENGLRLGVLDVTVRDGKVSVREGRLIPVDAGSGSQAEVAAIVEDFRRRAGRRLDEVVGSAEAFFNGEREAVRTGETSLGSLLAHVVMETAGADAALVNGGSVRASIPAGPVTLAHLYDAFPFDGHVVSFRLTGAELRQAIETGLARLEDRGGGFPQVAGLSYRFDPALPPRGRLVDLYVGGLPVGDHDTYVIATNDFLAAGGDGYRVFAGKKPVFSDEGTFIREAVASWWRERGAVTPMPAGRIAVAE